MRSILGAILGAALFSSAAMAAPLYVSPSPTWTGYYVGGNIGYSWGEADTDITAIGSATRFAVNNFPSTFTSAGSNTTQLNGVIGGGQIGYNFRLNRNWVVGIETDIQASAQRGTRSFENAFSTPFCITAEVTCISTQPLTGTAQTSYEAKIGWFGTLRPRVGYLLTDDLLIYGTGGLAYGNVQLSGATNVNAATSLAIGLPLPFASNATGFSVSKTNVGYSVGMGAEGSIWLPPRWRWKVEYLFVDLGSLDAAPGFTLAGVGPTALLPFSPVTGSVLTHAHFTDHVVRVGLNYAFWGQ